MPRLVALSLGAGVQSSTLLLMACKGVIPKPHLAVFADTGWEPKAVYTWFDNVLKPAAAEAGIPLHVVSVGNIRENTLNSVLPRSGEGRKNFTAMPLYAKDDRGKISMLRRQCTSEYKIYPIRRFIRQELQARGSKRAELWLGISTDEVLRVRESGRYYLINRYPLIELNMSRDDCVKWLADNGYPQPAKSSCIGCPFHDDHYWRDLRDNRPDEWQEAVEFDRAIRNIPWLTGSTYLHRNAIPLEEVNLERGKEQPLFDAFDNECEGMCGV